MKNYVAKQERKTIATEVGDLTTAKGLYRFCVDNGYGKGFNESWGIQHFQLIVDSLMPGECVFFPFMDCIIMFLQQSMITILRMQ